MIRSKTLLFALAGTIALGAGIWLGENLYRPTAEPPPDIAGIYFPEQERQPVEDFSLTHQSGRAFTAKDLKGHWTFLYFGYTYCPDACPLTLSHLSTLEQHLARQGLAENTAYIFVSVDPARDTPQRLGEYTAYFGKNFQGVTGTPEQLSKLAKQFGIYYDIPEQQDKENYTVDHSSSIVLVDPDARLEAILTHPDSPETLFTDFMKIYERYQSAHG